MIIFQDEDEGAGDDMGMDTDEGADVGAEGDV